MIYLYRFLIAPVLIIGFFISAIFSKKIRRGLWQRLESFKNNKIQIKNQPIWIHASSGEFEYAKPVIREIKKRIPEQTVLVTYFSPTYQKQIEAFPGVDVSLPLPLDVPNPIQVFLNTYHPKILLIARTDLWPELLFQTRKFGVACVLFSTTQPPFKNFWRRWVKRYLLSNVDKVFCVSEYDKANLTEITGQPVEVIGDTRYDQVIARLAQPQRIRSELFISRQATVIAGSTWPADESVLLPALKPLLDKKLCRLILVPHEPTSEHIQTLCQTLDQLELSFSLYSSAQNFVLGDVLLVDCVGVLAELYLNAEVAFVGGSFRKSVHSVMEPLAAGLPVLVGPFFQNNREAMEFQKISLPSGFTAVTRVRNATEMTETLKKLLALPSAQAEIKAKIASLTGASARLVNRLQIFNGSFPSKDN